MYNYLLEDIKYILRDLTPNGYTFTRTVERYIHDCNMQKTLEGEGNKGVLKIREKYFQMIKVRTVLVVMQT